MITITNIRGLTNDGRFDENWAIVRSMKSKSAFIRQVPALSPSPDLFHEYLRLKEQGRWGRTAFRDVYVPRFLKEMHAPEAIEALNRAYALSKHGKNLALACFCPDESLCHRSIVAGLLQGVGANVRTNSGADYSTYYGLYRQYG